MAGRAPSTLRLSLHGLALRGLLAASSLANVVLLARALGPAGRGEYALFVAFVAVATRLADAGLSPSAVVFASRHPDRRPQIHRALLRMLLLLWLAAALVGGLVVWLAGDAVLADLPRERAWLALALLPLTLYEQLWIHLMVGLRQVVRMNLVQAGAGLLMLLLNLALVVARPGGVAAALAVYVCVMLARVAAMLLVSRPLLAGPPGTPADRALPRAMFWFGLRGYPNGVAALLWTRLPWFVLSAYDGLAAVGIFSVAQQTLEQLLLPVQATQDAIYQRVAGLPRDRATAAMNRYLRLVVWGMLLLILACAGLAPWAVPLVFGGDFRRSALVFQILLASAAVSVAPVLLSPYFFGQLQRPGLISLLGWGKVLGTLGLSLALAPAFAELGVAVGLATGEIVWALAVLALYVRLTRTSVARAILPRGEDVAVVLGRLRATLRWT